MIKNVIFYNLDFFQHGMIQWSSFSFLKDFQKHQLSLQRHLSSYMKAKLSETMI